MMINPRVGKDFAKAMMKRSKTDASDARMLAEYAGRMAFVAWSPPKAFAWELRAIARRMDVFSRQSVAEKNRLHSSRNDLVSSDIEVNIRHLKRRMEQLQKKVRISKVGNSHLRYALYMPAQSASMYDEHVKRFREQLAQRGKTPMQGVIAVMRKRLHTIYGVLKNKTPYDATMFYQNVEKIA